MFCAVLVVTGVQSTPNVPLFSNEEKLQIQKYWSQPGRYVVEPLGERVVRQTAEGSTWLAFFRKELGYSKENPSPKLDDRGKAWKKWVDSKLEADRKAAEKKLNRLSDDGSGLRERTEENESKIPAGLEAKLGAPPIFYDLASPKRYTVTFEPEQVYTYTDHVKMSTNSPYYRFPQGVMSGGVPIKSMPNDEFQSLLDRAGITEREAKIFRAVSMLEGGFDSVNTYDTGFVSVGFIQFACLKGGAGSLGTVLQRFKMSSPSEYELNFRRFGIDVHEDGRLIAVDIISGEELVGTAAALAIIEDKRLIATFQRAGRMCDSFRIAQLQVAKERYYPAYDTISVKFGPISVNLKVEDIVQSEAGIATLMDRKVNLGNIDLLPAVLRRFIDAEGLDTAARLCDWEREIIRAVRWRKDFLASNELTQPREISRLSSRSGSPKRGGGMPDLREWW